MKGGAVPLPETAGLCTLEGRKFSCKGEVKNYKKKKFKGRNMDCIASSRSRRMVFLSPMAGYLPKVYFPFFSFLIYKMRIT